MRKDISSQKGTTSKKVKFPFSTLHQVTEKFFCDFFLLIKIGGGETGSMYMQSKELLWYMQKLEHIFNGGLFYNVVQTISFGHRPNH